ncbi:MAG: ferritin-like domain-containing protein [Acidimicrobiales bacterium]
MNRRPHRTRDPLGISEAELEHMTAELDEFHRDASLPALHSSVEEWVEVNHDHRRSIAGPAASGPVAPGRISRRGLLLGTGAAAIGGVLLAACGTSNSATTTTVASGSPASLTGDLKVAALAASLENLGVYAYGAGIKAAQAGKLGSVPPAVVTFATTAMAQHTEHAAAWNSVLTGAGKAKVTETDPALTPVVNQMFGQVVDVGGLAKLALEIENIAAQTYQVGIGVLSSTKAIETAASIHPVEMQHAAILNLVLGNYPVPNAFNPTTSARPTSDLGS